MPPAFCEEPSLSQNQHCRLDYKYSGARPLLHIGNGHADLPALCTKRERLGLGVHNRCGDACRSIRDGFGLPVVSRIE